MSHPITNRNLGYRTHPQFASEETQAVERNDFRRMWEGIESRSMSPRKLLEHACISGNIKVLNFICSIRTNPNFFNKEQKSPLMLCVEHSHYVAMKTLINDYGADVNLTNRLGKTVLQIAIQERSPKFISYLSKKFDFKQQSFDAFTNPLYCLKLFRPRGYKHFKKTFESMLAQEDLDFCRIALSGNYLAHCWRIGGTSLLIKKNPSTTFSNQKYDFEGSRSYFMLEKIRKSISRGENERNFSGVITDAISHSFCSNPGVQHAFFIKKDYCFFRVSAKGHCYSAIVFGQFFIILNRGFGSKKSVDIYKRGFSQLTAKNFQQIQEALNEQDLDGLYRLLKLHKSPFETFLEKNLTLSGQIVGNCTWDNTEGVVLLLSTLLELKNQYLLKRRSHRSLIKKIISERRSTYNQWLFDHRFRILKKYLNKIETQETYFPDDKLLEKIRRELYKPKNTFWIASNSKYREVVRDLHKTLKKLRTLPRVAR